MDITMTSVKSSNIEAIGYQNNCLYVKYTSGVYCYSDVPQNLFEDLQKAESKGRFVNDYIKYKFNYTKIS